MNPNRFHLLFVACIASILTADGARAAEWAVLEAGAAGLFRGGAAAVSDDGQAVFGHADVAETGTGNLNTPVRWLRQPGGSFLVDPLGEGATPLDLPRGSAIDVSADGATAALYGLSRWTEAGGIDCGPFCPVENENTAITADGASIASTTFLPVGVGQRVLLWSDAGLDVIDAVDGVGFGQLDVWDVSSDGTVAVGEYPGPNGVQPVLWTRVGLDDWQRTLPGLPPGANVARAYRVSADGQFALVQWSPTDYGNMGFATILWSAANGYEDIAADGCRPDALNADGSVVVGRCEFFLGRWIRGSGWEEFSDVPTFAVNDLTPDGRYAVGGGGGCGGSCARWADLGPVPGGDCQNGLDDDGDGLTDFGTGSGNDPGCVGAGDLSERDPTLPCDDGADNDGDGYSDYPADPACQTLVFTREDAACQDGINNDGDGLIDFDGGASWNGGVPLTEPDPNCVGKPWRNLERAGSCGLGAELPLVFGALAWARKRRRARR